MSHELILQVIGLGLKTLPAIISACQDNKNANAPSSHEFKKMASKSEELERKLQMIEQKSFEAEEENRQLRKDLRELLHFLKYSRQNVQRLERENPATQFEEIPEVTHYIEELDNSEYYDNRYHHNQSHNEHRPHYHKLATGYNSYEEALDVAMERSMHEK